MNSKLYLLFIVDNEGALYFIESDFKDSRNTSFNAPERLITLVDEKSHKLGVEVYSVKNIDGEKLLVSCVDGTVRIAQVSSTTNTWKTSLIDLKAIMQLPSPPVL